MSCETEQRDWTTGASAAALLPCLLRSWPCESTQPDTPTRSPIWAGISHLKSASLPLTTVVLKTSVSKACCTTGRKIVRSNPQILWLRKLTADYPSLERNSVLKRFNGIITRAGCRESWTLSCKGISMFYKLSFYNYVSTYSNCDNLAKWLYFFPHHASDIAAPRIPTNRGRKTTCPPPNYYFSFCEPHPPPRAKVVWNWFVM